MDEHGAEQIVFLAYAAVFKGQAALIRNLPAIRNVVSKHQGSSEAILERLGTKKVIKILHSLLKKQVFESQTKARIEFPELFSVSPERAQQRSSSQAQVTQSETEVLDEIASQEDTHEQDTSSSQAVPQIIQKPDSYSEHDDETVKSLHGGIANPGLSQISGSPVPSLYPLYLPYQAQHRIFVIAQQLLEQTCYDFSLRWLPDVLEQSGWHCWEAIELNKWTQTVVQRLKKLPMDCITLTSSKSIEKTLGEVNKIRHTAVHRLHTSVDGLLDLLRSAVAFSSLLKDNIRSDSFSRLLHEVESKAQALAMNKNFLEQKIEKELDEIAKARDELQMRERNFLSAAQEEDSVYSSRVGALLVDVANRILADNSSTIIEDDPSSSDEYFDDAIAVQDA